MDTSAGLANPGAMDRRQTLYVWLVSFFVACLLMADIVGVKLFKVGAVEHTCGMLTFPVTFLLTDLLSEYYGKKGARRATFIAFGMALFAFGVINVAQAMPYLDAPYNVSKESFDAIFGSAKVMYVASLSAFLVGQLADIAVFGAIKRATRGKLLFLRATGSTVISQLLDSFVVSYLAFGLGKELVGQKGAPFGDILGIAATGYALKFVLAMAITPLIYLGHGMIHRWLGLAPAPPEVAGPR